MLRVAAERSSDLNVSTPRRICRQVSSIVGSGGAVLARFCWIERTPSQRSSRFFCASGDRETGSLAKRGHSSWANILARKKRAPASPCGPKAQCIQFTAEDGRRWSPPTRRLIGLRKAVVPFVIATRNKCGKTGACSCARLRRAFMRTDCASASGEPHIDWPKAQSSADETDVKAKFAKDRQIESAIGYMIPQKLSQN